MLAAPLRRSLPERVLRIAGGIAEGLGCRAEVEPYLGHVPGCYVFIGSANTTRGLAHSHHSPLFDFDEEALAIGCELLVRAVEEGLAG